MVLLESVIDIMIDYSTTAATACLALRRVENSNVKYYSISLEKNGILTWNINMEY
jgi:hypothetical protein